MKKFILTAAMMTALVLMPATAQARNNFSTDRRANNIVRVDNRKGHKVDVHRNKHRVRPAHGTRFSARPIGGKYYTHRGERLWLADGVLYKEIRLATGTKAFVVVGYIY